MNRQLGALFFAAIMPPAILALAPDDRVIADLYARGLGGDQQAVISCIAALEARHAVRPNDQLVCVYLGSAWTLRSRDLPFGPGKLSALRQGMSLMDEAAARAPNDARVRLLRAVTYEAFPSILGRRQIARRELEDLVGVIEKSPGQLQPADEQLLYLNAGEAARKAGDKARAGELWRRGLAINAEAKLTQEIRQALAQL
jgi:hypothetical protein